ncbi:hypothetical protein [uncultured Parolsenella sp.]|nr:hypothetical protein [uncultured Parolsenella sp.]
MTVGMDASQVLYGAKAASREELLDAAADAGQLASVIDEGLWR